MLIDTHCHLDFPEYDLDRDAVIKRAKVQGVEYLINIGSSIKGSERSLALAKSYDSLYAAVGIHPHEADNFKQQDRDTLARLAQEKKVVAIGEIGLDFYKNYSKGDNQRRMFASLLELSKEAALPLVIHTRQAEEETLGMLDDVMPVKAVVHCFSGNDDFLKACLGKGFFISFTCNVTYKKAEALRAIVKDAPLDRIMLETDAPYLSPEGSRGRRNEPSNIRVLAEVIARIKSIDTDKVAEVTSANAREFFNLP